MKKNTSLLITLFFLTTALSSNAAVKVVECEDENGNRSFETTCPPGTTTIGEKKISTGTGDNKSETTNKTNIQATLYQVSGCDACEQAKEFLSNKGVSVIEKEVSTDVSLQKELTDLSGALKVPTTIIGDSILTGYNRSEFLNAIEKMGYVDDTKNTATPEPNSEADI